MSEARTLPVGWAHVHRRIDAATVQAFVRAAETAGLSPEQVIAVGVHDLLCRAPPLWEDLIDMLWHVVAELERWGNVADPENPPPVTEDDPLGGVPAMVAPWNYVPGRPPAVEEVGEEGEEWDLEALVGASDEERQAASGDAVEIARWEWRRLTASLARRYRWVAYPTAEARILLAAPEDVEGLPQPGTGSNTWSVEELAAARSWCERYVSEHPTELPAFPERELRHYDAISTPAAIASFARSCEDLDLNPEDAIVLAVHDLCAGEDPDVEEVVGTIMLVIEDIEVRGQVMDPVLIPADGGEVQ